MSQGKDDDPYWDEDDYQSTVWELLEDWHGSLDDSSKKNTDRHGDGCEDEVHDQ